MAVVPVRPHRLLRWLVQPVPGGLSLALVVACQSPPPEVLIRVENHQVSPLQYFGLLSDGHSRWADPATVPRHHKVAPPEVIHSLLDYLEEEGFPEQFERLSEPPLSIEPQPILRRLCLMVGEESYALVVPRRPDRELAERFSRVARNLGAVYNELDFPRIGDVTRQRPGRAMPPNPMEMEKQRLEEESGRRQDQLPEWWP